MLVKLKTIAQNWETSVKTVRSFAKKHGIKFYYLGPRCLRVDPEDFKKWESAERGNTGEYKSKSKAGELARRLGPARKRSKSTPRSAEIVPFPAKDCRQSGA